MYYGAIKYNDIANGPGVRTAVFVSGCTLKCKGCFQPETWDFNYGTKYTKETQEEILESLKPEWIMGLTVLGGEPFEPKNQKEVYELIAATKQAFPNKTVWLYTGHTLRELYQSEKVRTEYTDKIMDLLDVMVEGRFVLAKRNLNLDFCGSENQRVLDMKKTRLQQTPVLWTRG